MTTNKLKSKRILIVEVNWLGDVLFSTSAIKIIRNNFPDSFIACMILPRVKEIIEDNPCVNKLVCFDEDGIHKGIMGKLRFIFTLRREKFDTVFLFHRSFTRLLFCFLAGIETRIGYYTKKRSFLLTHKIIPPNIASMHRAMYYIELLKKAGLDIGNIPSPELFVREEDKKYVNNLLVDNKIRQDEKFIVLNPGANWFPKRWPKEYFAKLSQRIISELNIKVIFSGSAKDIELVNQITSSTESKLIQLCGKTNLKQLAALFEKAAAVVSADSGPMHIANCVGAKLIAIFGPTSKDITGPFGKGYYRIVDKDVGCVLPCYEKKCLDNRCMKEVGVNEVFDKLKLLLEEKNV